MYTEAEVAVGAIANSSYRLLKKAEKRVNYPRYGIPNFPIEDNNSLLIEYEFNCESKTLNYNINNVLITHLRAFYPDLRVVSICFMI